MSPGTEPHTGLTQEMSHRAPWPGGLLGTFVLSYSCPWANPAVSPPVTFQPLMMLSLSWSWMDFGTEQCWDMATVAFM